MEIDGDSPAVNSMTDGEPDPLHTETDDIPDVSIKIEELDPIRVNSGESCSDSSGIIIKGERGNESPKMCEIYIKQEPVEEDIQPFCAQDHSDEDVKDSLDFEGEPPACEVIIKQDLEKDEPPACDDQVEQKELTTANNPLDLAISNHINVKSKDQQSKPKIFQCPFCTYSSDTNLKLKSHTLHKHSKDKPHRCPHCNYATVTSTDLKRHIMSIHSKEKPHRCPHCDYGAVSVFNLKTHVMAQHTKEKPHHCPQCDYTAVTGTTLKRHIMSIHTEEKPHQCSHCSYATVHAGALKRHVMSVHFNEKPLQCPYCNYGSVFSHHIKRHVKRRHTKETEAQSDKH